MSKLFCQCGYPIWVSARWNGSDIILLFHDGNGPSNRDAPALIQCPRCQRELAPTDLEWLPEPTLRWPPPTLH